MIAIGSAPGSILVVVVVGSSVDVASAAVGDLVGGPSAMLFATLRTNLCHPLALFSVQPQAPQNPQLVRQV
jgi:hypothetical protein